MPLNYHQQRTLSEWMRSRSIVHCPAWEFAEAAYLRALLEAGDADLTEGRRVVKITCGYVTLFDAAKPGLRGM